MNLNELFAAGKEAYKKGDLERAKSLYQEVLKQDSSQYAVYFCLGLIAQQQGDQEAALSYYQETVKYNPDFFDVHQNLGNLYQNRKEFDQAIIHYQKAIQLQPNNFYPYAPLGRIYIDQNKKEQARETFKKFLNLNQSDFEIYALTAYLCQEEKRFDEAEKYYLEAIKLNPNNKLYYLNLGVLYKDLGKFNQALNYYNKSLEIDNNYEKGYFNRSLIYLVFEQWDQGFSEYEYRFKIESTGIPEKYRPKTPIWNRQELKDKSIVIWSDQGLGDVIQFIRYVNLLPPGSSKIIISIQKSLISLFQECLSLHSVHNNLEIVDREICDIYIYDYQIPFLSLPGVFKTNLNNIPADIPYIIPPKNQREKCVLPSEHGFKIGIVWGGEPKNTEYSKKSCSPEFFTTLLALENVVLYSLQVGPDQPKIKPYLDYPRIVDLSPLITDFVDTVCLIKQLDLVITIDTSVAHLVGAMGRPVWVLLPFVADWRWLLNRQDSPWYPTMKLFRQANLGDWEGVFKEVKQELISLVETRINDFIPLKNLTENKPKINESDEIYIINLDADQADKINYHQLTIDLNNNQEQHQQKIGISWPIGSPTGWGVYGWNLTLELQQKSNIEPVLLVPPNRQGSQINPLHFNLLEPLFNDQQKWQTQINYSPEKTRFDFPVLHGLGNNFAGSSANLQGKPNIGMIFFENTQLSQEGLIKGRSFDLIIAGSTWNEKVLRSYGFTNVKTVIQGVDPTIFHPAPKSNLFANKFVVFSGGKLEYRKGQDIIIAAFKIFQKRHPEALLLTAWHNFWPQFMQGLETTGNVTGLPQINQDKRLLIKDWLVNNGIPSESVIDLGLIPNHLVGQVLREADVAVFTNRCEGGTNLAAMECLACGIPTILSANTGHLDLIDEIPCYSLRSQSTVKPTSLYPGIEGWGESSVEEVLENLEKVYQNREESQRKGEAAAILMQNFTWQKQVNKLLKVISF